MPDFRLGRAIIFSSVRRGCCLASVESPLAAWMARVDVFAIPIQKRGCPRDSLLRNISVRLRKLARAAHRPVG
jgi:hypothetical protein